MFTHLNIWSVMSQCITTCIIVSPKHIFTPFCPKITLETSGLPCHTVSLHVSRYHQSTFWLHFVTSHYITVCITVSPKIHFHSILPKNYPWEPRTTTSHCITNCITVLPKHFFTSVCPKSTLESLDSPCHTVLTTVSVKYIFTQFCPKVTCKIAVLPYITVSPIVLLYHQNTFSLNFILNITLGTTGPPHHTVSLKHIFTTICPKITVEIPDPPRLSVLLTYFYFILPKKITLKHLGLPHHTISLLVSL